MPALEFVQLRERLAHERAALADGERRDAEVGIQLNHAADGTVLKRGGNGVRRLNLRVEHVVDAVERTRCGQDGLRAPPRHVRRRVVGVVPDTGDFLDVRIDGIDE